MIDSLALQALNAPEFAHLYNQLAAHVVNAPPFDRGEVHAQKVTQPEMVTREIRNVSLTIKMPPGSTQWKVTVNPNLPWAEDHFKERISGEPLNPPPSNEWWPYAQAGNAEHKIDGKFSHTYPERFYPKFAGVGGEWSIDQPDDEHRLNVGIRFAYGDLSDLIEVLAKNKKTRQAYLPVWFPEDLAAAVQSQRVPCTLGYHFLMNFQGALDASYYMRSCDLVRFFRDDVYMAGRLLQHVSSCVGLDPGFLRLHIANLHAFVGDDAFLRSHGPASTALDKRASYDFGALG
jgi:hypothetical protein